MRGDLFGPRDFTIHAAGPGHGERDASVGAFQPRHFATTAIKLAMLNIRVPREERINEGTVIRDRARR